MRPIYYLSLCLFFTSCALSKNIVEVPYRADEKFLTSQEMQQLKQTGQVSKAFSSASPTDTLRGTIKIVADGDDYRYVEVGDWEEVLTFHPQVWISGKTRAITTFDSLGNFIQRKVYEKPNKQSGYYLREDWTSRKENAGGQERYLETVWVYDQNGEKTFEEFLVENHTTPISWRQKKKHHINATKYYDAQGTLKREVIYDAKGDRKETKKY